MASLHCTTWCAECGYEKACRCNSKAGGDYDTEWGRWAIDVGRFLLDQQGSTTSPGAPLVLTMTRSRPGASIRSVLAGMFAMNGSLRERYPALAPHLEQGLAVAIDGQIYQDALLQEISADSEVHVLPQIAGG